MRAVSPLSLALALTTLPLAAPAHPHVFVDTGLRVVVGADGMLQGLEISWTYDDFYSLLLFADLGLDQDGDGRLRPDEVQRLAGFDLQWIDGYEGDAYVSREGETIALGAPEARGVSVEAGRITTTHFRAASAPAQGLVIKAYDPTFYTAYSLVGDVAIDGPCKADVIPVDLDAAYSQAEELLYGGSYNAETDDYPAVGEAFADTVTLTCAG